MRTFIAIIIAFCFLLYSFIRHLKRTKDRKENTSRAYRYLIYLGILAALINGASTNVVHVNGLSQEECVSKKYFLVYPCNNLEGKTSYHFLTPYSTDWAYNNTDKNLCFRLLQYHRSNLATGKCQPIAPSSLFKIPVDDYYLFQPVPKKITLYKDDTYTTEKGIIMQDGYAVRFRE